MAYVECEGKWYEYMETGIVTKSFEVTRIQMSGFS
jgi:hypothetical protein